MVILIQHYFHNTETFRVLRGSGEGIGQFLFRVHEETSSRTQHIRQAMIFPGLHVIVRSVLHGAFGAVTAVVQHHHNRIQPIAQRRADLHTGHLKRAVAHQHQRARARAGHLHANARRHREAHRGIICEPKKFRTPADVQVRRTKQRFAHITHHHGIVFEESVEVLEQSLHRHRCARGNFDRGK